MPFPPDHAAIAARAHRIWVSRGRREGRALDDWLQAERELRAEANRASSGAPVTTAAGTPAGGGVAPRPTSAAGSSPVPPATKPYAPPASPPPGAKRPTPTPPQAGKPPQAGAPPRPGKPGKPQPGKPPKR